MPLKVLIVEDARAAQEVIAELLYTLGGFDVVGVVHDEHGASHWIEATSPHWDIAIVDLLLAEGSGFNVLRLFRTAKPSAHLVVFSDFVTRAVAEKCIKFGANHVFNKGSVDALIAYLERLQAPPIA